MPQNFFLLHSTLYLDVDIVNEMDSLAFEKFQNAIFFKIFKFPFNEWLEMV